MLLSCDHPRIGVYENKYNVSQISFFKYFWCMDDRMGNEVQVRLTKYYITTVEYHTYTFNRSI